MSEDLSPWITAAGIGQILVLVASFSTPSVLRWREELASLPRLHRQLFWVYGGYVVLTIVGLASADLAFADELASGAPLSRAVCAYGAAFWGVRLCLQAVLDTRPWLSTLPLRAGYHLLTGMFAFLTVVHAAAALTSPGE